MKKAVVLVSHGSHSPKTKIEIAGLIAALRKKVPAVFWTFAFLEIESPTIPEGIRRCAEESPDEIIVLLNFLNSGRHVDEDIPKIVQEARVEFPGIRIEVSMPLGHHPRILDLFAEMINF